MAVIRAEKRNIDFKELPIVLKYIDSKKNCGELLSRMTIQRDVLKSIGSPFHKFYEIFKFQNN